MDVSVSEVFDWSGVSICSDDDLASVFGEAIGVDSVVVAVSLIDVDATAGDVVISDWGERISDTASDDSDLVDWSGVSICSDDDLASVFGEAIGVDSVVVAVSLIDVDVDAAAGDAVISDWGERISDTASDDSDLVDWSGVSICSDDDLASVFGEAIGVDSVVVAVSLIETDADAGDAAVADCEAVLSDTGTGAWDSE
jgi:hypothetical protein